MVPLSQELASTGISFAALQGGGWCSQQRGGSWSLFFQSHLARVKRSPRPLRRLLGRSWAPAVFHSAAGITYGCLHPDLDGAARNSVLEGPVGSFSIIAGEKM